MVFQLTYVSGAVRPWSQAELVGLLERSRDRNVERGVTGMLLYRDGRFLQLLEGAEAEVRTLFAAIVADPRHHDLVVLRERHRVLRQFPTWTMAFRDLGERPLTTPGYADVLGDGPSAPDPLVDDLVARLRAHDPAGPTWSSTNRVLGPA